MLARNDLRRGRLGMEEHVSCLQSHSAQLVRATQLEKAQEAGSCVVKSAHQYVGVWDDCVYQCTAVGGGCGGECLSVCGVV